MADHSAFHKGVDAICDNGVWHCPDKRINHKELCSVCGVNYKDAKAYMCIECFYKINNKFIKDTNVERPSRETLKTQIRNETFVQIGKKYGVSDNAVRKWCKFYGLPSHSYIIKSLSDFEWDKEQF